MNPKRRRELTLAGVAVLLAAIAAWSTQRAVSPPAAAAVAARPAREGAVRAQSKSPIPDVDLDALKVDREEPDETTRNPFRFKQKPAPPPMPSDAIIDQQQAALAPTGPVEPPPPPRIPLKYIGDMSDPKNPGKRIAILSDTLGTYHGREGDVVEGRYRIVKIGVESIELAHLDGRGRQTIRQTGQ